MQRNLIIAIAGVYLFIHLTSCKKHHEVLYTFDIIPDCVWCGEDFWTVLLEGWRINNGRVECISKIQQATFSILPYVLEERDDEFKVSLIFTIRLGYPEQYNWKIIDNIEATVNKDDKELLIAL